MSNFITSIFQHAEKTPHQIAIMLGKTSITYQELAQRMQNVSAHAQKHNMKAGETVVFSCKPTVDSLSLAFGLVHHGIALAILDPFTSQELFNSRANAVKPDYVIAPSLLYSLGKHPKITYSLLKKQIADVAQAAPQTFTFDANNNRKHNAYKWLKTSPPAFNSLGSEDDARNTVIVFTSGTTAEPKGVVHTVKTLSSQVESFANAMKISQGSVVYAEPMTLGLVTLASGGTWHLPGKEKYLPHCDVWFATPTDILKKLNPSQPKVSITSVGVGAAPVLPSLVAKIEISVNVENIFCVYGMTEMLPIAIGDARLKKNYLTVGDYVGLPVGDTIVSVQDKEFVISGSALTTGYLDRPAFNELATGDFGTILPDGSIILQGRKKDMFIRGNMNVYPGLYEPGLSTIKGVKEVALLGIPDAYGDDSIILAVSRDPNYTSESVQEEVEKNMKRFVDVEALPSRVYVFDDLPVSGRADKLDRNKVIELVVERMKYES